ncbi:hypothetical protein GQ53DRAFT_849419 [Thozetella sp. PMI_491]|nr:hypothetical protein GQ53DRAFT_849419 [Thozetella sp. PMI_491]
MRPHDCGQPHLATAAKCVATLQTRPAVPPKPRNGGRPSPTREQWEGHHATIRRLYLDENITLNHVIEHMKAHYDFHGTRRMYKKKLKEWHLDIKNVKRTDAIVAIQTRSFEDPDRDFVLHFG